MRPNTVRADPALLPRIEQGILLLRQVFDTLRELMDTPPPKKSRPIGFARSEDGPADKRG